MAATAATPAPTVTNASGATVPFNQQLRWQARWYLDVAGGLYDFRARTWSPDLGAFLEGDEFEYMSRGGTLWSWTGQNPLRYRDPSGRFSLGGLSGVSIGASVLAISATYSLMLQQRYAQYEDMALAIQESASAAHAGMYSVLGATPLTDLTNVVVDELGEAGRRTGEIFAGAYVGAVIFGRWVAETSQVARRAKTNVTRMPQKCTLIREDYFGGTCTYKCLVGEILELPRWSPDEPDTAPGNDICDPVIYFDT